MSTFQKYTRLCLITVLVSLTFVGLVVLYTEPVSAQATSTSTVTFDLMKKFSGPVPAGYTANQFSFNISTIVGPISLVAFTDDTATNVVNLPVGTYTITENGPAGFVSADWTVQWSGAGCVDQTGLSTTITVEERHIGLSNFGCRADNQWKPQNNDEDPEPEPVTGTLLVSKLIVGTTTVPASDFSFTYTGALGNIAFEGNGTNTLTLATGIYSVTEVAAAGYTTTYSNCSNIVVVAGATTTACVITNALNGSTTTGTIIIEKQTVPDGNLTEFTFNPSWSVQDFILRDGQQSTSTTLATGTYSIVESPVALWSQTSAICSNGSPITAITLAAGETVTCVFTNSLITGGGGDDDTEPRYLVFGYVWHDANENDTWEMGQTNPIDNENNLAGWTVEVTNGATTYATTTDSTGYYYFYVPAGTWTLTEVVQLGWQKTFPNVDSHTVVVVDESVIVTQAEVGSIFRAILAYVIPTTYAAAVTQYGPLDFGNVMFGTGGDASNGGGSSGGRSNRSNDSSGTGGGMSDPAPMPLVLGEATSVLPVGAPDTGAGGTAPITTVLPTLSVILTTAVTVRRTK